MESPPKISHDSFTFRFPARLWRIINSCSTGAISWGPSGKTIRILRKKFEEEYLTGDAKPFKTTKYESFVRQLNHYGFKKVKKRSTVKKITTPIMHGESKEEAAMLSEYHNPNFTRGQPERVTFLERRSQLHDHGGQRKRNKRSTPSTSANSEIQNSSQTTTTGKKTKKETSIQVSQSLLPAGIDDSHNSSVDANSSTKSGGQRKSDKVRDSPTQMAASSTAELSVQARPSTQPYHPLPTHKPLSPVYQHPVSEGKPLRVEERLMYHHRPYYGHDSLEPRYIRPSVAPSFPRHMSPSWYRPFPACSQSQLYDHYFSALGSREDPLYPTFATESRHSRHSLRFRSPETDLYSPLPYPESRYNPHVPSDAWEAAYGINRRSGIPVTGAVDNECQGQYSIGKRITWTQKHSVSSYGCKLASPYSRHITAPDSFSTWPYHQFSSPESRTVVKWRRPYFAGSTQSKYTASSEFSSRAVAERYGGGQALHGSFSESLRRQENVHAYNQTRTLVEPVDRYHACVKNEEEPSDPVSIHKDIRDISSEDSGLNGIEQEQTGGLITASSKNEEEAPPDYSENMHIITDDAADLPLDVAEETVITCNSTSSGTSDHCLPLTQNSPAEEKVLVDSLMNTSASFPAEDAPSSFHLPAETSAPSSRHHYYRGIGMYASSHPNNMQSPPFSQEYADSFPTDQEGPQKLYTSVSAWRYLGPEQARASTGHCDRQDALLRSWTLPASHPMKETSREENSTVTNGQMPVPFTGNPAADSESPRQHHKNASDRNHRPTDLDVDYPKTTSESENGHLRAKVVVQREERGDLTQLSSTSVQELLSAALRTPGMKIMVDENCHPEKMVLVIPKGKRKEVNGCV